MLKHLFTSNTRVKLLTIFLNNPESEYFIRELTRKLDEQINSVRRELDNLKMMGLLKTKSKNRKKYYVVNKNFVIYNELKSIILKSGTDHSSIAQKIQTFGELDLIILSGIFIQQEESAIDLLLVGNIDRKRLEEFFTSELQTSRPVRFCIMNKDEYLYRLKFNDKFIHDIRDDKNNVVVLNKLNE